MSADPKLDPGDRVSADDPAHDVSAVTRFGTAVGAGVVVALLASLPAALRVVRDGQGPSLPLALAALAALALPASVLAVGLVRRLRVGLRVAGVSGKSAFGTAVLAFSVVLMGTLSIVGAVLRAKTHHHGLAGTTFALVALVVGIFSGLLAARVGRVLAAASSGARRGAFVVALLAAFGTLALVGLRTANATDLPTAHVLVDLLALVVSAAVLSSPLLARAKGLALAGVPAAVAVAMLGISTLHARPALAASIAARAQAHAVFLPGEGGGSSGEAR